jgi:hypothetical protein
MTTPGWVAGLLAIPIDVGLINEAGFEQMR